VIAATIRWAAILASAFVAASFLYFAVDQTSNASASSVRAIRGGVDVKPEQATKVPNPPAAIESLREKENSGLHEFIDDVDDVLLSPFTGITDSDNIWVQRLVPGVIALFLYGFVGLYLAQAAAARRW
jgi:hypothetical protein